MSRMIRKLEAEIELIKQRIEALEDNESYEAQYIECLNEEGAVKICGIEFDRSRILKELDETCYRIGLQEYADSERSEDDEYIRLTEKLEELKAELFDEQNIGTDDEHEGLNDIMQEER